MSAKTLLIIALVWFGAVVLWHLFDFSFAVAVVGHGQWAKATVRALGYLLQIFTLGWITPLIVAVYRFAKKH